MIFICQCQLHFLWWPNSDCGIYLLAYFFHVNFSSVFCGGLIQIVDSSCLRRSFIPSYIFGTVGFIPINLFLTFFSSSLWYCLHNPSIFHWLADWIDRGHLDHQLLFMLFLYLYLLQRFLTVTVSSFQIWQYRFSYYQCMWSLTLEQEQVHATKVLEYLGFRSMLVNQSPCG